MLRSLTRRVGSANSRFYVIGVAAFAAAKGETHGITFYTRMIFTGDAYSDLKTRLYEAIDDLGADLIVLGSHPPGFTDHILPSTSSSIVKHVSCSVLVVR